ncbi:molybdenum cofactor sulfurase [Naviculisporaceae sp. PSN 640]
MAGIEETYPEYRLTSRLDELRATEYSYLDEQNHVYLDYTGSGLASKYQHQSHNERVTKTLFGNPHSVNPTSIAATEAIEKTRARILAHLKASSDEYVVIFTPNATGAARIVAESYPFTPKTKFVLTADNHNSINGIREFARAKGAKTTYVPLTTPDLRVDEEALRSALSSPHYKQTQAQTQTSTSKSKGKSWVPSLFKSCFGHRRSAEFPPAHNDKFPQSPRQSMASSSSSTTTLKPTNSNSNCEKTILETANTTTLAPAESRTAGLFAYPAQSNFSGTRHPLSYIPQAQQAGYHVLLDTAAYLPTSQLDLSPSAPYKPDFLIISFYKLFGVPTGVGALVARRDALSHLLLPHRPWFSGGTITAVTVSTQWHQPSQSYNSPNEAFEDGTLNFMSIPDIIPGLDFITQQVTMPMLETRVRCLTGWFLDRLASLRHSDGTPMAVIYGGKNLVMRGGTVAFNLLDAEGKVIDERIIDIDSAQEGISLRTGCFCNPGAAEAAFGLTKERLEKLSQLSSVSRKGAAAAGRGWRVGGKQFGRAQVENINKAIGTGMGMDDYIRLVGLPSGGAIRVSFGVASNTRDVDRFFEFVERTYRDRVTTVEGLKPRERW